MKNETFTEQKFPVIKVACTNCSCYSGELEVGDVKRHGTTNPSFMWECKVCKVVKVISDHQDRLKLASFFTLFDSYASHLKINGGIRFEEEAFEPFSFFPNHKGCLVKRLFVDSPNQLRVENTALGEPVVYTNCPQCGERCDVPIIEARKNLNFAIRNNKSIGSEI